MPRKLSAHQLEMLEMAEAILARILRDRSVHDIDDDILALEMRLADAGVAREEVFWRDGSYGGPLTTRILSIWRTKGEYGPIDVWKDGTPPPARGPIAAAPPETVSVRRRETGGDRPERPVRPMTPQAKRFHALKNELFRRVDDNDMTAELREISELLPTVDFSDAARERHRKDIRGFEKRQRWFFGRKPSAPPAGGK